MSFSMAADWDELNNRFYRKQELYDMCWQGVDLSKHLVSAARYGGPIAIVRDEGRLLLLGTESTRPKVRIFTASGIQMAEFYWTHGRMVKMGWTDAEALVCVTERGDVYQYNVHGKELPNQIFFGKEVSDQLVADCVIWGSGLVVLTKANQLYAVTSLAEPLPQKLHTPSLAQAPHCMTVVEPQFTVSGTLELLLSVGNTVFSVDAEGSSDQQVQVGPIHRMAVSPDGKFLACFTSDGCLLVLSIDFSKNLSEFGTKSTLIPDQLAWCGVDSVLAYWQEQDTLLMVGPYGDIVKYTYDEPVTLIPEVDGARVLTNSRLELLQRVPDATVSVFKIGSTAPAAMLFDALDHFDKRSAKADENLRLIGPTALPEAVEACIEAASYERDLANQKALLRAASYGRTFCSSFPRDRFRDICKVLRVLNSIRHYQCGIPLTIAQYRALSARVLINRLVNAHRHLLALKICDWLALSKDSVLRHWACAKLEAAVGTPDSVILEALVAKLKQSLGTSYARIAEHAFKAGRPKLAAALLDYEPRAAEQVPLLLTIGEDERALAKAVESGDTDLVYYAVFHLQRQRPEKELFKLLQAKPLARDLFINWARENDLEELKKYYFTTGNAAAAGEVLVRESYQAAQDRAGRGSALTVPRVKILEQAAEYYAQTKEHAFQAKAAEEAARLLKAQQDLEISTGQMVFVDTSLSDSIRTCITMGNHKAAQKLRVDFKVPDKRFYWIKAQALGAARDWEGLEKFAKERKPPGGYGPFVEVCIEQGNNAEATKYIARLADPHARAEAYARLGMVNEAAEAAAQAKDGELLNRLKSTFGSNTAASALIDTLRERLSLPT